MVASLVAEVLFPGRVPHVRPAYMGRKRILQLLSVHSVPVTEALEGAAPHKR
jgi:hypothetical protein